jgi:COMPASS component SWD2
VIHASTKGDDSIRYMSLHDNNYLRYYKGHQGLVTSLEMAPMDDTFLSAATDDTVRLWDLRTANAQGLLNIAGRPAVSYDPSGAVFAVIVTPLPQQPTLLLYDLRNYERLPFLDVTLPPAPGPPASDGGYVTLTCSNNGKHILIGASGGGGSVLDAFDGHVVARLEVPGMELGKEGEEWSWTPDGKYAMSGSSSSPFSPTYPFSRRKRRCCGWKASPV